MKQRILLGSFTALCGALLTVMVQAGDGAAHMIQARHTKPTLFVIAVKEAQLLTMCPEIVEAKLAGGASWKPNGQVIAGREGDSSDLQSLTFLAPRGLTAEQRRVIDDNPRLRAQLAAVTVRLPKPAGSMAGAAGATPSLLERVSLDAGMSFVDGETRDAIEKEIGRQRRYDVVESADAADYVLIAEATYVTREPSVPSGGSSFAVRGDGTVFTKDGAEYVQPVDRAPNLRQSLLAIVVPGDAYRRTPDDIGTLLKSRVWEGSVLMQRPYNYEHVNQVTDERYVEQRKTYADASPESLVRQLHGKEGRVNSHCVLCAATNKPFRLEDPHKTASSASAVPAVVAPSVAVDSRRGAVFRAAITYVPVSVAVSDAATGGDIRDVGASEFHVFENDVEQKVDRVLAVSQPFNLALLVDTSTSMRSKVADIQEAALSFVDAVRSNDQLMVVSFVSGKRGASSKGGGSPIH